MREAISATSKLEPARTALPFHQEAARVLRRTGYSDEFIGEVLSHLPDPFDPQSEERIIGRYGLSAEHLMDRMGGSP